MERRRFRAWRFVHPDFDAGQAGLRLGPSGAVEMVDADASVRQSILLLLSTRPGERVMRPDYGCFLHRLVFNPNDDTTAGLAMHYVRRAIERWEKRVDILDLDASANEFDPDRLDINLVYRVIPTRARTTMHLQLDLMGMEV